jgi:hypothetical protein
MLSQGKIGNECIFLIQKNKIRLKETLINTTENQTFANDMYINQMKINKLNKEL